MLFAEHGFTALLAARLRRLQRLLDAADYRRVFSAPDFKAGQSEVLLLARRSTRKKHRLGLAVAKKHVASAVGRNRLKRLARERFRFLADTDPSLDIVVLTRPGAEQASRGALRQALDRQFTRVQKKAQQDAQQTVQQEALRDHTA